MQDVKTARPTGALPFAVALAAAILGVTLWHPPAAAAAPRECKPATVADVGYRVAHAGKIRPSAVQVPVASSAVAQRKHVDRGGVNSGLIAVSYVRCLKVAG